MYFLDDLNEQFSCQPAVDGLLLVLQYTVFFVLINNKEYVHYVQYTD